MRFKTIIFILGVLFNCQNASAHEIAFTFDDLPCQQEESAAKQFEINKRILKTLKDFKAPAIGFVNESKLYNNGETSEKTAILKLWIDEGFTLGNHTYSHNSLNNTNLEEFKEDVTRGATVSRKLMKEADLQYSYFRHPYLHTGTTKETRASFEQFLQREGYIIAPATIDTDDWIFNKQLIENPNQEDKIIKNYLEHIKKKFDFYEQVSQKLFNRNIKHIWLLHANLLNSYAMKDLLQLASQRGYTFINLEAALQDKAYSESDNYYQPFGVSWLYRWDYTRGKVIDWSNDPEPDKKPLIRTKSLILTDKRRNRSIPLEIYLNNESVAKAKSGITKFPVVILNHGYTVKNTEYSFIANHLAANGYLVASIQHDLPGDPELPKNANLFERRMSGWKRGVENIKFVISELKRLNPGLNFQKVILIGHSNGGDISMLFTDKYPEMVTKVISLDSLRYPFPTKNNIPILSLRANDTKADDGVLPLFGATMVYLKDTKHIDMYDRGPEIVKIKINDVIIKFLRDYQ